MSSSVPACEPDEGVKHGVFAHLLSVGETLALMTNRTVLPYLLLFDAFYSSVETVTPLLTHQM